MTKSTLVVIALAAVAALVGFQVAGKGRASVPEASAAGYDMQSSGSMASGDVLVELTPKGVENGRLVVDFAMNTHSVSLSGFDLKELTTLRFADRTIKPSEVTAPAGHHAYGQMVFDTGGNVKDFTITVEGIPLNKKRVFAWKEAGG